MTKSQNTKNEQHCIKQNEKSFIQKDLSLTEQWKKGELPDGEDYYIKWKDSEVFTATFVDFMGKKMFQRMELEFEELPIEHYLSVLAPVPSYKEWKAKLEENAQLKELLKWCAKIMREPAVYIGTLEEKERYINNLHKKQQLLHEIDEVLK